MQAVLNKMQKDYQENKEKMKLNEQTLRETSEKYKVILAEFFDLGTELSNRLCVCYN